MTKVLVLGVSGMLGHAVFSEFENFHGDVSGSIRSTYSTNENDKNLFHFDAFQRNMPPEIEALGENDFVINCIGLIKPYISDDSFEKRENAITLNSALPYALNKKATEQGFRIIQIATDCVFSGIRGDYLENDAHDALDVYGKTKSLGEVPSPYIMHVRTSIIGEEFGRASSLLEWVVNQPRNAQIPGYLDHIWNGVTTLHFAKLCRGVIENNSFKSGVFHFVPKDKVTKNELVSIISKNASREDIQIKAVDSGTYTNRTLGTNDQVQNSLFWNDAGYAIPPKIVEMIEDLNLARRN